MCRRRPIAHDIPSSDANASNPQPSMNSNILLLDDDPDAVRVMVRILSGQGDLRFSTASGPLRRLLDKQS